MEDRMKEINEVQDRILNGTKAAKTKSYAGALSEIRAQRKLDRLNKTIQEITGKKLSDTQMSVKEAKAIIKNFKRNQVQTQAYEAALKVRQTSVSAASAAKNLWRGLRGQASLQDEILNEIRSKKDSPAKSGSENKGGKGKNPANPTTPIHQ